MSQVNVYSFGGNARAMASGRTYPEGLTTRVWMLAGEELTASQGFRSMRRPCTGSSIRALCE